MLHIIRPQLLRNCLRIQPEIYVSNFLSRNQLQTTQQYRTTASLSTRSGLQSPPCSTSSTVRKQTSRPCRRSFINLSKLLPNNNKGSNNAEIRTLQATRTLPFPPSPLYKIIASVESYAEFLPFLAASTVTARDPDTDYPSQAFLTVGYGPFQETFTSRVTCDRSQWLVEARSGGGLGDDGKPVPGGDEGLFSHLGTRWKLVPRIDQGIEVTEVQLEIRFRFQNAMHTAMMGAVEDKVAAVMIEAFERRIKEQMVAK
ncbi:hypothetical protein BGW36DRAFT_356816 [Talaromyces proteolyticus]|uniref:Coenzyme Q-binding protein COQ10 START domain-containing protein n=1 Tax=Talaromyces proteolyticus TaxID=1131652 RepID=A0AAD4Q264_9EURO|nr:uncharacterized protein BGW36DRAFT_356816 [Talaromyces proteolyticus]KAH8700147.1 hypothetical protein BGW36DRAFT_356816 [Talaromyces proteolyticus]